MDQWPSLAFGINAAARPWNGELAAAVEALGFGELWANDTSAGSGLDTLADAAAATRRIRLAVGVLGLSEHEPEAIRRRVGELDLPLDRLTLGVGSGSHRSLATVLSGVEALRDLLPGIQIALAAVGPRMAELAADSADVVLLNWIGPRLAAERRQLIQQAAAKVGRPAPRVGAYVRVAVGRGAGERLATEQARYLGYGGSYASVIRAQVDAGESQVGIALAEPGGVPAALADYADALDTVVVRALPAEDTLEGWLTVARAATLPR